MTEIEFDVQETLHWIAKGIIVAKKPNGDRLYFKIGEKSIYGIELIPLTPKEAKELGVEETCTNEKYFNFEVEESMDSEENVEKIKKNIMKDDSTTEEQKAELIRQLEAHLKKTHTVDMQNLESVEKAKQVLAEREKVLASEQGTKTREEIESENEDLKAKLEIVAEKELEKKMERLGLSENQKNRIRTAEHPIEVLKGVETGMSKQGEGYSPLAGQYSDKQNDLYHRKFDSYEEMISKLHEIERDKEHPQSADASLILSELVKRHFSLRKQAQIPESTSEMPTIKELTKKKERNPVNPKNREEYK